MKIAPDNPVAYQSFEIVVWDLKITSEPYGEKCSKN